MNDSALQTKGTWWSCNVCIWAQGKVLREGSLPDSCSQEGNNHYSRKAIVIKSGTQDSSQPISLHMQLTMATIMAWNKVLIMIRYGLWQWSQSGSYGTQWLHAQRLASHSYYGLQKCGGSDFPTKAWHSLLICACSLAMLRMWPATVLGQNLIPSCYPFFAMPRIHYL